jgi:hypothetical protein
MTPTGRGLRRSGKPRDWTLIAPSGSQFRRCSRYRELRDGCEGRRFHKWVKAAAAFEVEIVEMMRPAPVVAQVLEGEDAIARYRDGMGATNPERRRRAPSASNSRR